MSLFAQLWGEQTFKHACFGLYKFVAGAQRGDEQYIPSQPFYFFSQ